MLRFIQPVLLSVEQEPILRPLFEVLEVAHPL